MNIVLSRAGICNLLDCVSSVFAARCPACTMTVVNKSRVVAPVAIEKLPQGVYCLVIASQNSRTKQIDQVPHAPHPTSKNGKQPCSATGHMALALAIDSLLYRSQICHILKQETTVLCNWEHCCGPQAVSFTGAKISRTSSTTPYKPKQEATVLSNWAYGWVGGHKQSPLQETRY